MAYGCMAGERHGYENFYSDEDNQEYIWMKKYL